MRAFLLLLVVVLSGCGPALIGSPAQRRYSQNSECKKPRPDVGSQWVQSVMCGPLWFDHGTALSAPLELDADPLPAAALVAACTASPHCEPEHQGEYTGLAFAWDLAHRLDVDAIAAALARGSLPSFMQADFLARYRAAAEVIEQRVTALGPRWRDVFLRPVSAARAERAAADAALAGWPPIIEAFEVDADQALVKGAPERATLDAALAMRRNYVAECRVARGAVTACLGDASGLRLTALIRRLAKALDDETLLTAESELERLADLSDPRATLWTALNTAIEAERARYAEYAAAHDQGISQAALDSQWPVPPLEIREQEDYVGPQPRASGQYFGGRNTLEVVEVVRTIKRSGTRATIKFRKDVVKGIEATGCYETSKVQGFDDQGNVIYRTNCTGERAYTEDRTVKPVAVPWSEVAKVKAGEVVHLVIDRSTREGHVVWVGAPRASDTASIYDTPRVQLREWRLVAK